MKLFFVCSFFFSIFSYSQSKVNGSLKTEKGKLVSGASVVISELSTDNILNYDITNSEGEFSIIIKSKKERVQLKIRSMGYKTVIKDIDNKTQTLDFVLEEELTELNEIVVKSNPITRKGDTINYAVSAFTKQDDRTIADVLKNMPGIEVLNSGKILYQGRPINKYYIEGLDLLEGKYNLANSNLPHKEVTKIQVLENHQPVKMLDSLVYSDQAAINIKLKNSYTFTGQAEVGAGFSPLLWDVNITPMLFSKKRQMLSSYQANNTGNNVASQLKTLTIEDLLEQFERNDEKSDWLSIQEIGVPNFSEQRWLDNNIHLITTNYLQKLKKDYELRLNVSYINDSQKQRGFTNTQFFTVGDTIVLFEENYNKFYTNNLEANLTLQKNTDKNFFKNSLIFKGVWDSDWGIIQRNNSQIDQNLSNRYFKLSNDFKKLFPLGKQIATLKSYIGFNRTPQYLIVNPGQFNDLINNGSPYDEITQNLELKTIYTNNSLGYTKGWKQLSFSPKFGFQFNKQRLESEVSTSSNTGNLNFKNNLDWINSKLYFHLKTQYQKNEWRIELNTPINFYNYNIKDTPLQQNQNLKRLTFEPRVSINYNINSLWRLRGNLSLNNQFGAINQLYYNYILKSYRNIQRIDAPLPEKQNFNSSASINYRNPIKALFFNFQYANESMTSNLLYNNTIFSNGGMELKAIEQNNKRKSHNLMTRVSKYFSDFNTNITLSTSYNLNDFKQIINSEITNISNKNWRFNGKIDIDVTDWLNTEIESTLQFSNNEIQEQDNRKITQQFHEFNVNAYPTENRYIGLKLEYVKNNLFTKNTKNLFANIVYRYTWKKKNIDFELLFNNIFNTENYRTININDFSYIESNFRLRPRQLLFNVRFSL